MSSFSRIVRRIFLVTLLLMMISPVPAQAVNDFSNDFSVVGLYRLESGALTTNNSPVVGCGGANSLVNSSDSVTANASAKEGNYSGSFVRARSAYLYQDDANLCSKFPGKSGTSNTSFAISMWFKLNSLPHSSVYTLTSKGSPGQRSFLLRYDENGLVMYIGSETRTIGSVALSTDNWYHLGLSYNASNKSLISKLVREDDTVIVDASITYNTTMSPQTGPFAIGSAYNGVSFNDFFDGLMDEVVIFNTPKTIADFDNIRKGNYVALNPPTLSSPINGSSSVATDTDLSWTDTNTNPNETGYSVCIGISNTSPPANCTTTAANTTSVSAATALGSALSEGTTYYWTVKALGDNSTIADFGKPLAPRQFLS